MSTVLHPSVLRRYVSYCETLADGPHTLRLSIKIPRGVADLIAKDCARNGQHVMVFYCDLFANAVADWVDDMNPCATPR